MESGDTPLHQAVRQGDARSATRLLMNGADFRIKNASGQLALNPADKNWKNIWGTDMPDSLKEKIKNGDDNLLKEYVSVRPKWARAKERDQRKLPTWAESLEEPELWV